MSINYDNISKAVKKLLFEIPRELEEYRVCKRLSQKEMAELLKMPQQLYSKTERGERPPTLAEYIKFSIIKRETIKKA